MNLVVLCDFDGTALTIDTCVLILEKFADADWKIFDEQLEKGEITLEECLQKQFSTVRVAKETVLKEAEAAFSIRRNFGKLVEYCIVQKIPLTLVSAGLDFVIERFLELNGWQTFVEVYAPKAQCTSNGITFDFPKLFDKTSVSFKDDFVKRSKKQSVKVVYIGDGLADYEAAANADYSFAVKGSKLSKLLDKNAIPHAEIDDFLRVIETIQEAMCS